jgi:hypothetical protein
MILLNAFIPLGCNSVLSSILMIHRFGLLMGSHSSCILHLNFFSFLYFYYFLKIMSTLNLSHVILLSTWFSLLERLST